MQPTGNLEQLAASHAVESLANEHKRDFVPGRGKVLQQPVGVPCIANAHDPVVPSIAIVQLALDIAKRVRILVDGQNHRIGHRRIVPTWTSSVWSIQIGLRCSAAIDGNVRALYTARFTYVTAT